MMKKIRMNCTATLDETFADFLLSRRAKGLAEKTLESYSSQWKAVARHLDTGTDIAAIQKADLDAMIVSMRDAGLSPNSINSYTRVLKSFFSWCNEQGITRLNIPLYKAEETVKETYSDAELTALLKKPDIRKTTFAEYRDWVIVNFLLNCGSRAATVRAIQIRDVDLDGGVVFYRHTKNRKAQVIPLCSPMIAILREYGRYRGGEPTDYLFCTETGTQLTENGLRQSIARYNMRRGVQKTSIHLFRHTFARKYLIDCGGDAFTLQKLLGHSTLAMTKHYCAIYDADLTKNYDNFSPLAQMKASGAKIKMPAKGRCRLTTGRVGGGDIYICQTTKTEREVCTSRSYCVISKHKWLVLYRSISKRIDPQFTTEEIRQFLRRNENFVIFLFLLVCPYLRIDRIQAVQHFRYCH